MIAGFRERYHISGEINSTVDDVAAALQRLRDRYADGRQTEIDGLSVEYDDWHFNVRPSNTEPLLRLNLESLVSEEDMERKPRRGARGHPLGVTGPRSVPGEATAVIAAEALEVRYQGGPEPAVRGVTLRLGPGQGLLLRGPGGRGQDQPAARPAGAGPRRGAGSACWARLPAPRGRAAGWATGRRAGASRAGCAVIEAVRAVGALRRGDGRPRRGRGRARARRARPTWGAGARRASTPRASGA